MNIKEKHNDVMVKMVDLARRWSVDTKTARKIVVKNGIAVNVGGEGSSTTRCWLEDVLLLEDEWKADGIAVLVKS